MDDATHPEPLVEPTFACAPPPGTARVDVVLAAAGGTVPAWVVRRLPQGYRPVPVPLDAAAPDGLSAAWAIGLARTTAPVVALVDGRCGVDPRELERLAEPVARGSADLVLGSRRRGLGLAALLSWPPHRRLRDAAAVRRLNRLLAALTDPGPRVADAALVLAGRRQLLARADGGGPEELLVAASRAGWRVEQVLVRCGPGPLAR